MTEYEIIQKLIKKCEQETAWARAYLAEPWPLAPDKSGYFDAWLEVHTAVLELINESMGLKAPGEDG